MKITIEFKDVDEYIEFKEKTAQEGQAQEQPIELEKVVNHLHNTVVRTLSK